MTASQLTAVAKAAKALAKLSNREWAQVKCAEDRRRSDQRTPFAIYPNSIRELRDRKIEPGNAAAIERFGINFATLNFPRTQ